MFIGLINSLKLNYYRRGVLHAQKLKRRRQGRELIRLLRNASINRPNNNKKLLNYPKRVINKL
jgi:hypothetical protein